MTKSKVRRMKLEISCKRKGVLPHGMKIEWDEPEENAIETFNHFCECVLPMLKSHGLMQEKP